MSMNSLSPSSSPLTFGVLVRSPNRIEQPWFSLLLEVMRHDTDVLMCPLDYDSSAELAYKLPNHVPSISLLDSIAKRLFGGLANWDGIYFTGPHPLSLYLQTLLFECPSRSPMSLAIIQGNRDSQGESGGFRLTFLTIGIATRGYAFEQYHAFFPLLPALIKVLSTGASSLTSHLSKPLFLIPSLLPLPLWPSLNPSSLCHS